MENPQKSQGYVFGGLEELKIIQADFETHKDSILYEQQIMKCLNKHFVLLLGSKVQVLHIENNSIKMTYNYKTIHQAYGDIYIKDPNNTKNSISITKFWSVNSNKIKYEGLIFDINSKPGYFNTYNDNLLPKLEKGDVKAALDHIFNIWCKTDQIKYDYVIKWLAWKVQNPFKKIGVALVLHGMEGAGKGIIVKFLEQYYGPYFNSLRASDAFGRFNSAIENLFFVYFDESYYHKAGEQRSDMKRLITEEKLQIEEKNLKGRSIKSVCSIISATNDTHACGEGLGGRRTFILNLDEKYAGVMTPEIEEYVDKILKIDARHFIYHLKHEVDLNGFNPRTIPDTEERRDQIEMNLTSVQLFWRDVLINSGDIPIKPKKFDPTATVNPDFRMEENKAYMKANIYQQYEYYTKKNCTKYNSIVGNVHFWKETKHLFPYTILYETKPKFEDGFRHLAMTLISLYKQHEIIFKN